MSHEVAEADQNLREIARLRAELDATSADLDTLRNGVVWLGAELDRAKRWGALWKRAAKEYRAAAHFACCASRRRESRIQELRAAIEAERRVARYWNSVAVAWMRRSGAQQNSLETMRRVARLLVAAWREERRKAKMWEEGTLMLISGWEWAEDAPEAPTEPPAQPQGGAAGE